MPGVSWWWRSFEVPQGNPGRVVLRFESVRLRAEVFVNGERIESVADHPSLAPGINAPDE